MRWFLRLFIIILIVIHIPEFASADEKDILSQKERQWLIKHEGKIRYAPLPNYPPVEFVDSEGTHQGVTADYLRLIEQKLGFRFAKVQVNSWNEIIKKAKKGEIDVIGSLQNTPERREYLRFTKPYLEIPNVIIVREEYHRPLTLEKMEGMKVVIVKGYASISFIKNNYPKIVLEEAIDDLTGLQMVSFGIADAIITDLSVASYLIEQMKISNLRVAGTIDYVWDITFASRKDWPILNNILKKGLAAIDQKERQAIYSKWVPSGYEDIFPRKKLILYFAIILSITGGGVAIFFLWNRMLKRQVLQQTVKLQDELNERKMAENELLKSEEKYRALFEYNPVDTIFVDNEGKIIMYNLAKEKSGGRLPEIGEIIYKDYAGKHQINMFEELMECIRTGRQKEFPELKYKKSFLYIKISPFSGGAIITSIDLTEIKTLQKQFAQAQKMESVGRLAGGVAHDYNNALGVIIGYTEFAMMDADPTGSLYADLNEVLKAARRAKDITRQLLAFARKQTIAPIALNLNANVESTLKMLQRLMGEDIDFTWLPETGLWSVKMDPSQIDQILANLSVNARDAIEGVGKVTIETKNMVLDAAYCSEHKGFVPGQFVLLAVSDNGCGMSKEIQDNIFEPFFTTKAVDKGTGLGLSTVYGIVKQNNGFINVYSEPGKGTTIRIYLPRHEGAAVEIQGESTAKIPQGQGETILLVEDDLPILKLAQKILEGLAYNVLAANSPKKAVQLAKEYNSEIHLLVTDVIMPEMNGLELSKQLKLLYPDLKCIFMSGYTANAIAHHGVLDEGVHFVQKPFAKKDLALIVRKVLDE